MPTGGLGPNEISHFNLQEQAHIQVPGLPLFNLSYFILRLQRLGPAKVTPDSDLLFNKKGAQCKEQVRKVEGRREGKGRERRKGRREARSLVILLLSTSTISLYLTHAYLRC